jgi:hypothetical protein
VTSQLRLIVNRRRYAWRPTTFKVFRPNRERLLVTRLLFHDGERPWFEVALWTAERGWVRTSLVHVP